MKISANVLSMLALGVIVLTGAGCAPGQGDEDNDDADQSAAELQHEAPTVAKLPSGSLAAKVVNVAGPDDLLDAVNDNDAAYIHTKSDGAWYFKTGNYLLGIESFTQYDKHLDAWVDFGKGNKVAPAQARIVGHSFHGQGWNLTTLENGGDWPRRANSVWVIGTESGLFGMGGAPQGIPLGTEVFGSLQTYGGIPSTPYLIADDSPSKDSARIRAQFPFNASTVLGGHSAGSSAAKRVARDLGLDDVWLYGTPNYSRKDGEYTQNETNGSKKMTAQVINNNDDPVTNCLKFPIHLVSLAWGTAKCHNYSNWDYKAKSPENTVCQ